ncbi:MAG: AraC family transcriptional regulator [Verrucomicrobiae bacterium]|nr:AraC family transcriptional regulator [Verrucomicrobiae bacterium]NNJ43842.1 AraC family transcriptional regulator [Akkermansiaceae bacterium]
MPSAAKTIRQQFISQLATPIVAEQLFEQVPDIVFCIKNNQGQYISANPAFAERLGLSSIDEILGKTAADIFPPHLAVTYLAQDKQVFEQGREINDRLELVFNRDGTLGWYLARKIPMMGKKGNVIGLASISRDLLTPGDADLRFTGLAKVIDKIHHDFADELKPAGLAKLAELSQTQLERRMRKVFKVSTSQFIRKTRIEAAAHMLTDSDKAIINIAMDCGYGDQSAFTRQFKTTVGMTPGNYRAAYR